MRSVTEKPGVSLGGGKQSPSCFLKSRGRLDGWGPLAVYPVYGNLYYRNGWKSPFLSIHLAKLKYFTNLDFPEIRGCPFRNATFWGPRSGEVAIISPDLLCSTLGYLGDEKNPLKYPLYIGLIYIYIGISHFPGLSTWSRGPPSNSYPLTSGSRPGERLKYPP